MRVSVELLWQRFYSTRGAAAQTVKIGKKMLGVNILTMTFFDAISLISVLPAWYNAVSVFNAAHDSVTALL
jgi:hypothetical protein